MQSAKLNTAQSAACGKLQNAQRESAVRMGRGRWV
jgi:hypothetical protein